MTRQKVLIPLDGSQFSSQVVPYVLELLEPERHELVLLRVAGAPEGVTAPPPRPLTLDNWVLGEPSEASAHPIFQSQVWDGLRADLETSLMPIAERLASAGFTVHSVVRFGAPEDEIVDLVESAGVSLVVLATHGRSGVTRVLMGSVAGTVLRRLHVPVMMVRPRAAEPAGAEPAGASGR